ncbi:MAG: RNA polymerase sigma factor [Ideonella sp.]
MIHVPTDPRVHQAITAVWRLESARIVAVVMRMVRDLGTAEDLAQDALVAALQDWPKNGIPDKPGAWLTATAKRKALDFLRHRSMSDARHEEIGQDLIAMQAATVPDFVDALDAARQDQIGDDLLRLIFTACHPILTSDARVALTLKLLGGLTTPEIARAFLQSEATIAQRIVRAKRSLAEARVPFEIPQGAALGERLAAVLEVVYLIFNEGYTATSGDHWMRPELCNEALRLGRMLAELAPQHAQTHGLVALMEIQASRNAARITREGRPILLADQDRSRWDRLLIRRGLAALARAQALGEPSGPYQLQAAIAACHARASSFDRTDWGAIVGLYSALQEISDSPVVELNRAVAVAMHEGPAAGLALVDRLRNDKTLQGYQWLPAVRGDLLARLNRIDEACAELTRAAALTTNSQERALLEQRISALRER